MLFRIFKQFLHLSITYSLPCKLVIYLLQISAA